MCKTSHNNWDINHFKSTNHIETTISRCYDCWPPNEMVKLKAFPEDVCSSKAEMGLLRNKIMNQLHTIRAKAETEKAAIQNFSTFITFKLVEEVSLCRTIDLKLYQANLFNDSIMSSEVIVSYMETVKNEVQRFMRAWPNGEIKSVSRRGTINITRNH